MRRDLVLPEGRVWERFRRDPLALAALGMILASLGVALLAPLIATDRLAPGLRAPVPHSPYHIDLTRRLAAPGRDHWLGTDELGRDLLARMIHGARISMTAAISATLIALVAGSLLGALAGFYGGTIDWIVLRLMETLLCFPFLFILLAITALWKPSLLTVVLAIGLTSWTSEARLMRGEILRVREMEFAEAARASGSGNLRIIFKHLLPHAVAPVIVSASLGVGSVILIESALSFLGFGIPLPAPSWGGILSTADEHLEAAWWLALFPGLAIFLTAASFHIAGERLRKALDPAG